MIKKHLIDDWKNCWKWISMQSMGLSIAIQGVWLGLPDEIKNNTSKKLVNVITISILVLGAIGRVVKQPRKVTVKK
jgi:hypothetical protein